MNTKMAPHEKMNSITSVREQVSDIISELHTGKPNTPTKPGGTSRPIELGEEIFDFLSDQEGPSVKVKQ